MPQRTGKCTNYTKCTVAYRNEPISVPGEFVCPECGQPLHEGGPAEKPAKKLSPMLIGGAALGLVVIVGIVVMSMGGGEPEKTAENKPDTASQTTAPSTP